MRYKSNNILSKEHPNTTETSQHMLWCYNNCYWKHEHWKWSISIVAYLILLQYNTIAQKVVRGKLKKKPFQTLFRHGNKNAIAHRSVNLKFKHLTIDKRQQEIALSIEQIIFMRALSNFQQSLLTVINESTNRRINNTTYYKR